MGWFLLLEWGGGEKGWMPASFVRFHSEESALAWAEERYSSGFRPSDEPWKFRTLVLPSDPPKKVRPKGTSCIGCKTGRVPPNQGSDYCARCIRRDF